MLTILGTVQILYLTGWVSTLFCTQQVEFIYIAACACVGIQLMVQLNS